MMNETAEQKELLKEQKGKELAAKINDLDSIVVNFADTIHFLENIEENAELIPIPIIKNGVLIVDYPEFNGFILFDTELKDDKAVINADIFNNALIHINGIAVYCAKCLIFSMDCILKAAIV